MLVLAVAVPPTSGQTIGGLANENARVPAGNGLSKLAWKIRAAVDYPTDIFGEWGRREYARTQR